MEQQKLSTGINGKKRKRTDFLVINNESRFIYPPENGWKSHTWYRGRCSMNPANPIFRCLIFTGFVNDGIPEGYNQVIPESGFESPTAIQDCFFISADSELFTQKLGYEKCVMPVDKIKELNGDHRPIIVNWKYRDDKDYGRERW